VVSISDVFTLIGERIKTAREERGLTQAQLGEAIGYTQATIGNYELGRRHIGIDDLYKIAEVLGRPYAYFIGADGQVEEQAKREAESKVRRDVADFVGVRMLPVIRNPVPLGVPLGPEDISTTIPVPREFGARADIVFYVDYDYEDSILAVGDYIFVRRENSGRRGQVLLADVARCVTLITALGNGSYLYGGTNDPITTERVSVIGEFCGLYSEESFAQRTHSDGSGFPGWNDLAAEDRQQVQQFIDFLRARRASN
jgi:transcriptional regulator with XRE-family HTH domain